MSTGKGKNVRPAAPAVVRAPREVNKQGGYSCPLQDPAFDALLETLKAKNLSDQDRNRQQVELYYNKWVEIYQWLHTEFQSLWTLFANIETKLPAWFRVSPHGGDYDYLAVTNGGYSFGAGVEKNVTRAAPYPEKWLVVSFGWASGPSPGIGDERTLGRLSRVDATLAGLANCRATDLAEQAKAAKLLYERAVATPLVVSLQHQALGQEHRRLEREVLGKRPLVRLCQELFAALNRDEIEELRGLLPSVTPPKALPGPSVARRLLGR